MKINRITPAFSMLELIFVIVILGIVASIGSELIARVYEQYIVQRAQHRASIKTELAATQIANRLASAIPGTVFRKNDKAGTTTEDINEYMSLSGDSYTVLQWVGADTESFNYTTGTAPYIPVWSGFCDINASTGHIIKTPGSNLSLISTLMTNFGYSNMPALYFPYDNTAYMVNSALGETITLDINATHIVEHYKLARTSYALVAEDNGRGGKDLYLYYNFIPTPAIPIPSVPNNAKKSLLLANISSFKFKGAGRTIRFKICKEEEIGEDYKITSCKEKAVF